MGEARMLLMVEDSLMTGLLEVVVRVCVEKARVMLE